jgi:hypothetical protein
MPDGKVTYVKKGETYFLPYGLSDLQEPTIPVKTGDRVSIEPNIFHHSDSSFSSRYHFTLVKIVGQINSSLAMSH